MRRRSFNHSLSRILSSDYHYNHTIVHLLSSLFQQHNGLRKESLNDEIFRKDDIYWKFFYFHDLKKIKINILTRTRSIGRHIQNTRYINSCTQLFTSWRWIIESFDMDNKYFRPSENTHLLRLSIFSFTFRALVSAFFHLFRLDVLSQTFF